jgi:hypothetical protein
MNRNYRNYIWSLESALLYAEPLEVMMDGLNAMRPSSSWQWLDAWFASPEDYGRFGN